jgi:hypothetical protein
MHIIKSLNNRSRLVLGLLAVALLSTTSVFAQSKNRKVQWPETPINYVNATGSGYSQELAQLEALEINDISVGGNSITIGQFFAADDEWLKNLTVRVKNISSLNISVIQMNLFLPEIMPGGPMVTLCYGCGEVGKGQSITPGKEVEMKLVFYSWLTDQINAKSSLSMITKAEIHSIIFTLADGRKWLTGCVRTANPKNSCPTTAR